MTNQRLYCSTLCCFAAATVTILSFPFEASSFSHPSLSKHILTFHRCFTLPSLYSSVRDNSMSPPPDDSGGGDGNSDRDEFKNASDHMSEQSLPISFDETSVDNNHEDLNGEDKTSEQIFIDEENSFSSALAETNKIGGLLGETSVEVWAKNPYMKVVSNLSPSDLISKFTSTAHPRVQDAVRSTILGLIGSLPKIAFGTTTITTGERLASLMYQLQMTGYMFKNAEYRLSLSQSLDMTNGTSEHLLAGTEGMKGEEDDPVQGKVKGKIKIHYDTTSPENGNGKENLSKGALTSSAPLEIEVDAAAYMSEFQSEVNKLREELKVKEQANEDAIRKDLLLYIRTLPKQQLTLLTNIISEDVLVAMKGLVNVVIAGIGEGQIGPETVTEQSGEAMAQLCMWQLVVGYNMRELEVREEMKNNLFPRWDKGKEIKDEESKGFE